MSSARADSIIHWLPAATPERLAKPPLVSMLGQIRYPFQPELTAPASLAVIHKPLEAEYPRLLPEAQATLTVGPGGVQAQTAAVWRLTDLDRAWSLVLAPDAITIETTSYSDWTEFHARMERAMSAVTAAAPIVVRERLGLRYINHVRTAGEPPIDWRGKINRTLLGLAGEPAMGRLAVHLTEAHIQSDDGFLLFRYGAVNEAQVPNPAPPYYLLDIDCSNSRAVPFEPETTLHELSLFNDAIWRLFRWSFEETFYSSLKEGEGHNGDS